ncbi:MAG: cysteine protease StiP family protein [Lachnospiraceae bacterium]
MRSSYRDEDVIFLLKDITGLVQPQPAKEREQLIQSGKHYCEMLPIEYKPSAQYMKVYREALEHYSRTVALAVGKLADKIMALKDGRVVLVSLARAGTPIGILVKHFIKMKYGIDVLHYSVSIIRGKGIDDNAMKYLLRLHSPEQLLFLDGWIGKGAILNELRRALVHYPGVTDDLAVVADPANVTKLCGTHEDILIPSSCLNCTVSGLVSRTFLRDDIIGKDDFHGAVFYKELEKDDLSYDFIESIEGGFDINGTIPDSRTEGLGIDEVKEIAEYFEVTDINLIKPGIGETTRVLLRRVPWKILIDPRYAQDSSVSHILRLAEEKRVPVELYSMAHYKACGIIKRLADA